MSITIQKFRSVDGQTFEVTYSESNRRIHEERFILRHESISGNGGPKLKLLGADNPIFHNYIGGHPAFKDALFRLAQAEEDNLPVKFPYAVS